MEVYEQMDNWLREQANAIVEWQAQKALLNKERLEDMSRELCDMDTAGAGEEECKEKIREYLEGKSPVKRAEPEKPEGEKEEAVPVSGKMWGSTLRHFCRFAASEVPLSIRHVKVAEHCRRIMQQAREQGIGLEEMELDPQEQSVVRGTVEMGALVERGLRAQAILASGKQIPAKQYWECLRDFLAMKGVEEALAPHVKGHQEAISTGDGPASAIQILMAHRGFGADELRKKVGRTKTLARMERMEPGKVTRMIRRNSGELSVMGRQVMVDSYQMSDVRRQGEPSPRTTGAPQKGGPKV